LGEVRYKPLTLGLMSLLLQEALSQITVAMIAEQCVIEMPVPAG
jgi:hypothetical protein